MNTFEFDPITLDSAAAFQPYQECCCFGDTTFRALFSWQPVLNCRYAQGTGFLLVSEKSVSGGEICVLFRKPESDLTVILGDLMQHSSSGMKFGFVSEVDLPVYRSAAEKLGLGFQTYYEDEYSDYMYKTEDYCNLAGRSQKSLRGDVNALLRQIPDIRMELYRAEYAPACMEAFEHWCRGRNCSDCFYGCEKDVMARFLQVYREPECFGAFAFSGNQLLSFLIGEILPGGVLDIHFQKNTVRQRGLTYWLSREMALRHPSCHWIDLEEDMGLPGIRMDKQRLHPYVMRKKYTVVLQP